MSGACVLACPCIPLHGADLDLPRPSYLSTTRDASSCVRVAHIYDGALILHNYRSPLSFLLEKLFLFARLRLRVSLINLGRRAPAVALLSLEIRGRRNKKMEIEHQRVRRVSAGHVGAAGS